MKHDLYPVNFRQRTLIHFGNIRGFVLAFLLAFGSTAILAGCQDGETTTNTPITSVTPAASPTIKTEISPTISTTPADTTQIQTSPATTTTPTTSQTTKTETSVTTSTTSTASPTAKSETSPATSKPSTPPVAAQIAKAEEALKTLYTKQTGVPIQSVDCPNNVTFKAGSTFECQATAEGVKFGIQVNMANDQGGFESKTQGVIILSRIEDLLEKNIKEKAALDVTADCGGKLRVAKVGETFTCQVKNNKGQTRDATITVKDEQGNINVKL